MTIDISPAQFATVCAIRRVHLPAGARVWAFGSRAAWEARDFSDLDLALEGPAPLDAEVMLDLTETFVDSDLPWRVDLVDLRRVTPTFRAIVEARRVRVAWEDFGRSPAP